MLTVRVKHESGVATVVCRGSIVDGREGALLCAALGSGERSVIIDLKEVDVIDAAGRGALLALQAAGIYLGLINVSQPVSEMLRATGVDTVVEVGEEAVIRKHNPPEMQELALQPSSM